MPTGPHRRPFPRRGTVLVGAVLGVLGVLGGCSHGRPSAADALKDLKISDTPTQVVATAIERLDARSTLGADLNRRYERVQLASAGWSWADADCAAGRIRDAVGADAFDSGTVKNVESARRDVSINDVARSCASPESLARIDAKPSVATPDIDGVEVKSLLAAFYRYNAEQYSLTGHETDCVVDAVLGHVSTEDAAGYVSGTYSITVEKTGPAIMKCFTQARLDVLVPRMGRSLLAQKQADDSKEPR